MIVAWELLKRFWPLVLGAVALVGILMWTNHLKDISRKQGATETVVQQQEGVIRDVHTAKQGTAEFVDPSTTVKYCQCVRSARTPANCKRFLPAVLASDGKPAPRCDKPKRPN